MAYLDHPLREHSPNEFLASLAEAESAELLPHLKHMKLPQETILYEAGDTVKTLYFPTAGMISLVVDLATNEMIEAAMIGTDGVVGGAAALDDDIALCRMVVQIAGAGSALDASVARDLAGRSAAFRAKLFRHERFVLAQAQQSAACNAAHAVEARLSRWLLRCRDAQHDDDIPLTQEFLAEMLGVRRTTVSLAAHTLQQAGLIRYRRGFIRVLDLGGLTETACECHEAIKRQGARLMERLPA